MKNIELLNIIYKFFNRYITANELIDNISNMEKNNLSNEENECINKLLKEIKEVEKNNPNQNDDYIKNKKESIKGLLDKFDSVPKNDDNLEALTNQIDDLKKEYAKEMDSKDRWTAITKCIAHNDYFNEIYDNLTDYELLKFIGQYIKASYPPELSQEEFDRIVKVGISNDEREYLWRLAFNYEDFDLDFDEIVDYFIKINDGYYLSELICAVNRNIDVDSIIDKIENKKLLEDLLNREDYLIGYITNEQFNKIKEKLNN